MTQPKERPILFSGPMVASIIAGKKSQTRRIVKGLIGATDCIRATSGRGIWPKGTHVHVTKALPYCPYGVPGDRLWVREKFTGDFGWPVDGGIEDRWWHEQPTGFRGYRACKQLYYAADRRAYSPPLRPGIAPVDAGWTMTEAVVGPLDEVRWQPSIHMPRWASRLTLLLTEVRVQRLQQISEDDAIAEGFARPTGHEPTFVEGWNDIHGARAWYSDPWVWALSFTVECDAS